MPKCPTSARQALQIDGSAGEGGGQILRSSLSLSAITGTPIRLSGIRAGRRKPGLMRQHLSCVESVAALCGARTSHLQIGATELEFTPGEILPLEAGTTFAIGTAGSTSLLAQAILPVALFADQPSEIILEGGTHVKGAPCTDYLIEVFTPALRAMGTDVEIDLQRHGFFPAGGGRVTLRIQPWTERRAIAIHERSAKQDLEIHAEVRATKGLPKTVIEREFEALEKTLGLSDSDRFVQNLRDTSCQGNAVIVRVANSNKANNDQQSPGLVTLACGLGERGKSADRVVRETAWDIQRLLTNSAGAPVDEYLADQLLLPMALAGKGSFTTIELSKHFTTNVEVIQQFLDIDIQTTSIEGDAFRVEVG